MNRSPQESQIGDVPRSRAVDPVIDAAIGKFWEIVLDVQSQQHSADTKAGIARRKARLQAEKNAAGTEVSEDAVIASQRRPADD